MLAVSEERKEWLRCRPWIEAALVHALGTHTIEDVEDGIANGQFHFFCSANAAVVCELLYYPRMIALNYWLIGGDLQELIKVIEPNVSRWAQEQHGAQRVIGIGRKGFERAFAPSGFNPGWTAIYRDLG